MHNLGRIPWRTNLSQSHVGTNERSNVCLPLHFWALYPILIPGQSAKLKKLSLFTQIIEDNKLPSYISNQNFSKGNFRLLKLTLAVLG